MIIEPLRTPTISANRYALRELIDAHVPSLQDKCILAITSKIVSLCEGSVVPVDGQDRDALIRDQSDRYMPDADSPWGINFCIRDGILIPNAGIDESNAGDVYVLWPERPQQTANDIRRYLAEKHSLSDVGVVITDSTVRPLRRGVSGIAIAYSGFKPLRDYVQTPDLFGRPFAVSQADIVGGLAAAAVLVMGEGAESTPMALFRDVHGVEFVAADPDDAEVRSLSIPPEEDLFAPFLSKVQWQSGGRQQP